MNKESAAAVKQTIGKRPFSLSAKRDHLLNRTPDSSQDLTHPYQRMIGNQATQRLFRSQKPQSENLSGKIVSSHLVEKIQALQGGGRPLPPDTRYVFEKKMGYDFQGVRIHADEHSSALAENLNAMAFTRGRDIYFGHGQFNQESLTGQYLLAHELTHVAQQTELPNKYRPMHAAASSGFLPGVSPSLNGPGSSSISRKYDGETIQCAFPWLIAAAVAALAAGGVYAWWAHNCLAPVELPMYIATFGPDYRSTRSGGFRRWYFDQTGRPLASRLWDAFGHAYVACAATRRCGSTTAGIAGEGRELYREYIDSAPHDSYTQDTNNQALGRSFGNAGRDCEQACREAALNGSLDLTAPLVSFWTPARGDYDATPAERSADQARLAEEARQRQQRELEARLRAEYESCLALELERPGGVPSEEEQVEAQETCRRETGYPN